VVAGKATVKFFASPSSPFHGKVLSIQPAAIPSSNEQQTPTVFGTRLFTVLIEIAKPPFALKAGVTGDAKISAGYQSLGCCWSVSRPVCSNRSLVVASQSDFRSLTLERTVFVPSFRATAKRYPHRNHRVGKHKHTPFSLIDGEHRAISAACAGAVDNTRNNTRRMSGLFHRLTKKSADLRIDGIWAGGRSLGGITTAERITAMIATCRFMFRCG
jgi:hypothetical protein